MKYYSLAILASFLMLSRVNQQDNQPHKATPQTKRIADQALSNFGRDTVRYLRENFIINRHFYQQRSLGVLLSKLEVPVVKYLLIDDIDQETVRGITLQFFTDDVYDRKVKNKINPGSIVVLFKNSFPIKDAIPLLRKSHMKWNREVVQFYGKRIVSKLEMVNP